eukprot:2392734-Pleurochrysis_carterae.AAC.1
MRACKSTSALSVQRLKVRCGSAGACPGCRGQRVCRGGGGASCAAVRARGLGGGAWTLQAVAEPRTERKRRH